MNRSIFFSILAILLVVANCFANSPQLPGYSLVAPQNVTIDNGVLTWADAASFGHSGYKIEAWHGGGWKEILRGTDPKQKRFDVPLQLRSSVLRVRAYRLNAGNGTPTTATGTPFLTISPLPNAGRGVVGEPSTLGLSTNAKISYDRRLGKLGTTPGMFTDPVDFCFAGENSKFVFVLERNRVQKIALTNSTKGEVSLAQYSLAQTTTGGHFPSALALTTAGSAIKIWVAYPTLNALVCIEEDGTSKLCTYNSTDFPNGIYALGVRNNRLYAVGYAASTAPGAPGASRVVILDANGGFADQVMLARGLQFAKRLEIDSAGNIVIYAWRWQIFKFSPTGALLRAYGNGYGYASVATSPRGATFHNSVALAADDSIYSMRDGELIRIEGDSLHFTRPILSSTGSLVGGVSSYPERIPGSIFRVDGNDRLWALLLSTTRPGGEGSDNRPILVRVRDDVFTNPALSPTTLDTAQVGYSPSIEHVEPYGLYYETGTGHINVKFATGPKPRSDLFCGWSLSDHTGAVVQEGQATIPLVEAASTTPIAFSIPQNGSVARYGWFNFKVDFYAFQGGNLLFSRSKHVSVTPAWPQLVEPARRLEANESSGGLYDPQRAGWAGQILRLSCNGLSSESIATTRELALKCREYNAPCFLQITDKSDVMSPEGVVNTANLVGLAEGLGDVIKHFEIINEPTTGYTAITIPKYIEYLRAAHTVIKSTDPSIQIMGPALVNMNLTQIEQFLSLGGGELIDEFSIHDYEGNNTIYAAAREAKWDTVIELLGDYGVAHKPRWQTEHGTLSMFAEVLYPYVHMSRIGLQRDISSRSGVPPQRNWVFYLNDHGYEFRSWLWSRDGAYAAALLGRTHWALVGRKPFVHQLDFGPVGNLLYHGVGYGDQSGTVYALQDLGVVNPQPGFTATLGSRNGKTLNLGVSGGAATVYDAFGNIVPATTNDGTLSLRLTQSPQYVVLSAGARLTAPPVNFGTNQASGTTFSWSGSQAGFNWNGSTKGNNPNQQNFALLTDGIMAPAGVTWLGNFAVREGTPQQGTLLDFGATLTGQFSQKNISRIVLYGTEADNNRCTLMDYDLEIQKPDGSFEMVHQVRYNESPVLVTTLDSAQAIGYVDNSKTHILEFPARNATGFRLKVLRTSYQTEQSFQAQQIRRNLYGGGMPAYLSLNEIEIF